MPAVQEKTEELSAVDLGLPPPIPGEAGRIPPVLAPATASPGPPVSSPTPSPTARDSTTSGSRLRQPFWRLLKAYLVTTQVVVSYMWAAVHKRLRSDESYAAYAQKIHRKNAHRVESAVVELQGLFIKVGQLISIMANFLPEAFRSELQHLQDQVPPRPYPDIEARLREEFGGRGPAEVFAEFDERPVASASIGQVHVARLHSGEKVAVKVQYPDIEEIVRTDLRALSRIFWVARWFLPEWGLETIYREIREMVLSELDFRKEADAIGRIAANFKGRPGVAFPAVVPSCSTVRVLTTEWMAGTKASDLEKLAALGIDRRRAARMCVDAYCQQIFVDGIYHADPHPGNLLLRQDASAGGALSVVFLDFGAVSQVSEGMRKGLVSFLQGAMTRDSTRIVAGMKEMGFISRNADTEVFDRVVEYFHDKFRAQIRVEGFSLKDIRFAPEQKLGSLLDLRQLNVSLRDLRDAFHVPKEWVLLERTLLLLLGVCTTLDPEMNPAGVIQPYVEKFLLGEKKEWSEAVIEAGREASLTALALPGELGRFLTLASRGDVEVRLRSLDENIGLIYAVGQQLLWGILGATAAVLAVVGGGRGGDPEVHKWATGSCAAFGALLLRSLWKGNRAAKRAARRRRVT